MKRIWSVALFLWAGCFLSAQSLDPAVATIKLYKTAVIGQKSFREKVVSYEKAMGKPMPTEEKTNMLNMLILDELLSQAAEKAGIKVTEEEVIKQYQQANPGITADQIKTAVEQQNGMSWDKVLVLIKRQLATQRYVAGHPLAGPLKNIDVNDKEISVYYEDNKAKFVSPDMMRFSHIFFDTKVNPKGTLMEIKKRAEDVQKKIASGQATFEEMVRKESEDKGTVALNGDIGFLPRNLDSSVGKQLLQVFGKDFLDQIFAMKTGQVSAVLTSNSGFHIIKATDKIDQHFMTLDEEIYPGKGTKVKDMIKQNLMQMKGAKAQEKVLSDIQDELKKTAEIKTYPENM